MKNRKTKAVRAALISLVLIVSVVLGTVFSLASYDGTINQSLNHADEKSMYLYTLDISVDNACNSDDMDDDAVYQLWLDFEYTGDNGYGKAQTYRFDMSWKNGKNLNSEVLRNNFIRRNDNAFFTQMSVWVPGIVSKVKVHLNMDGGERLSFTVNGIYLNGFKINTDTDDVSSAYYDSDAEIPCYVPKAAIVSENMTVPPAGKARDQFGGLVSDSTLKSARDSAAGGNYDMIYHYEY